MAFRIATDFSISLIPSWRPTWATCATSWPRAASRPSEEAAGHFFYASSLLHEHAQACCTGPGRPLNPCPPPPPPGRREIVGWRSPDFNVNDELGQVLTDLGFLCVEGTLFHPTD